MIGFEWDSDKAARNLVDHRVSFEQAAIACQGPFAVEWIDESENYGEERICLLGLYRREVICVAYTQRGDDIRIISARRAERHEQDRYYRQNAA
jgi:uncharacterized protein